MAIVSFHCAASCSAFIRTNKLAQCEFVQVNQTCIKLVHERDVVFAENSGHVYQVRREA